MYERNTFTKKIYAHRFYGLSGFTQIFYFIEREKDLLPQIKGLKGFLIMLQNNNLC